MKLLSFAIFVSLLFRISLCATPTTSGSHAVITLSGLIDIQPNRTLVFQPAKVDKKGISLPSFPLINIQN
jgi:hypothetical protein